MFDGDVEILTWTVGPADERAPEIAVVGGIHGDEPAGIRAVRRVLEESPELQRPLKVVFANPPAAAVHRRYVDADMNRSFPGGPDARAREARLAAQVLDAVEDCTTLSIHTTHSHDDPIALVDRENRRAEEVAAALPVEHVVDEHDVADGAFTAVDDVVSIEAGRQLTADATENAVELVRAFLQLTDARPGAPDDVDSTYYSLRDAVEKPVDGDDADLLAANFERVEEGDSYARVGDTDLVAEDAFVPVLVSECGYDDIFGYRAERVGDDLTAARSASGSRSDG